MTNFRIILAYNGTAYHGWQRQNNALAVQQVLEEAILSLTGQTVTVNGCSRTDAGVHALGQVANFKTESKIPADRLPDALNAKLPKDISIISCEEVDIDFHARYNACGKTYRYLIYNKPYRSPLYKDLSYHVRYDLDLDKIRLEAKSLIGTHDFGGFMSSGSSVKDTVRTIYDVDIQENDGMISIEVSGNGFLYNMVRIIVGTLVDIGRGRIKHNMEEIINSKSRSMCGHTAPAHGLFLKKVNY